MGLLCTEPDCDVQTLAYVAPVTAEDPEAGNQSPLALSRGAPDQAPRLLDRLPGKEASEQEYKDFLP